MYSEKFVRHDDGRTGVIISDVQNNMTHRVVICDTGKEEDWHFQQLTWPFLLHTTEDQDGWIKHDGKGMPVSAETVVLVRMPLSFENGKVRDAFDPWPAYFWDCDIKEESSWFAPEGDFSDCRITHYKIVDNK